MQTTLLGLAVAIILALIAALVGPLLIDWGTHRSLFEAEASRLIGADVRVAGPIEARLLPSPSLTLHDIDIGKAGAGTVHARVLGLELSLGPMLRGEWQASEVRLVGPQFELGLDAKGNVLAPTVAPGFGADTVSIDRLTVEDGAVTLSDAANGGRVTLTGLWFNGDARSLLGPFKGEGAATIAGELYPFRLSTGHISDDGAIKLRLNVDPVNRPLSIAADGTLTLIAGQPKFDGTLNLTRPAAIARGAAADDALSQPWKVSGKIKASAGSALMDQFEFQYGSDEQGLKLTGVADFTFGRHPRFDGVLSGRQIDLDRALASADGTRPPPAAAIRRIAQLSAGAFRPAIPIQIGVGIDQVTLGGNTIANLRGDISTDAGGWNLNRFEFRAPGYTQVKLSGRLAVSGDGVSFTGPAEIEATDPKQLTAWLEGRADTARGELQPLKLRGDVTFGSDKVAVEHLQASLDRKSVTGRLAYAYASGMQKAKLDAELNAPELDLDAALGFGRALLAGSQIERPRDMTIAADVGRATIAGFVALDASVRVKVDGSGVQIDRLSIGDLGGARFSASGRIDALNSAPRGSLAVDFESKDTAAIATLVDRYAPGAAKAAGLLNRVSHAKLHGTLDLVAGPQPGMTTAKATIAGAVDAVNVNLQGQMTGDWDKLSAADTYLDGTLDAADATALFKFIGLDRYAAAGKGPGELKLLVNGRAGRDQQIDLRLRSDALSAQSIGHGRISVDKGVQMTAHLDVARADLSPLRPAGMTGSGSPLPFSLSSQVAVANDAVSFDDLRAHVGGSAISGKLSISPDAVSGTLDADTLDVAPLVATAAGMSSAEKKSDAAWSWSYAPFSGGIFSGRRGDVTLKARQVALLPDLPAFDVRGRVHVEPQSIAVDDVAADFAGGHLACSLSLAKGGDGMKTTTKVSLAGADAARLFAAAVRPPVNGKLDLSLDMEGTGLSPAALIGSLTGKGKVTLSDAQLASLDPRAFDAVTRAVDQGLPIDAARIADVTAKALDSGALAVTRAEGALTVNAGQVRLEKMTAGASGNATLSLSGTLDLTDGSIDARAVLSGAGQAAGSRPDIFLALKGPLTAPARSIDVSALTGWLTLRAVENQARQLREMENAQRQTPPPPPKPKSELAPALPAPVEVKRAPAPPRRVQPDASAVRSQN